MTQETTAEGKTVAGGPYRARAWTHIYACPACTMTHLFFDALFKGPAIGCAPCISKADGQTASLMALGAALSR